MVSPPGGEIIIRTGPFRSGATGGSGGLRRPECCWSNGCRDELLRDPIRAKSHSGRETERVGEREPAGFPLEPRRLPLPSEGLPGSALVRPALMRWLLPGERGEHRPHTSQSITSTPSVIAREPVAREYSVKSLMSERRLPPHHNGHSTQWFRTIKRKANPAAPIARARRSGSRR
jgi:hypothetical protein